MVLYQGIYIHTMMCIYEYVCFVVSQKNIPVVDTNQFKAAQIFFFPFYSSYNSNKFATKIL